MNNTLVKAIVDTGKPDIVEFQFLPGHCITDHSIITYDKMNGVEFTVIDISSDDLITCLIQNSNVFKLGTKYFYPGTVFFTKLSHDGEYSIHTRTDSHGERNRVEFNS